MKQKLLILNFIFIFNLFYTLTEARPSLNSNEDLKQSSVEFSNDYLTEPSKNFNEMDCDSLSQLAKKESFVLSKLAQLRALQKNCKIEKPNYSTWSELERKLLLTEIKRSGLMDDTLSSKLSQSTENKASEPKKKKLTELEIYINKINKLSFQKIKKELKKSKKLTDDKKFELLKEYKEKSKSASKSESLKASQEIHQELIKLHKKSKKNNSEIREYLISTSYSLALRLWRQSENEKSKKVIDDVITGVNILNDLIDFYFLKIRIADQEEKFDISLANLELLIKNIKATSPLKNNVSVSKILWFKAWTHYKMKNYDEAQKAFQSFVDDAIEISDKSKGLFFKARCFEKLNKKKESFETLNSIIANDFYSYYGLLSRHTLGLRFPPFKKVKTENKFKIDSSLSFLTSDQKNYFAALLAYNEYELIERAMIQWSKSTEESLFMSLVLAEKNQKYLSLFYQFAKIPLEQKFEVLQQFHHLIFPRPFLNEVKEMASTTGVSPSMIYAIMKQESGFSPTAQSGANARGLMQVIPPLAKHLAKKYNIPYKKSDDLFNPQINIKLGTYELADQIKKQQNQLTFVAAAYNAGPNALARWLRTKFKPHFDVIDFIEEIPYEETKLYVKIIARNYLYYDRLLNPDQEIGFPLEFINRPKSVTEEQLTPEPELEPES